MKALHVIDTGRCHYEPAYLLQKQLLSHKKIYKDSADMLVLAEHYPVFTIGRSGSRQNMLVSDEALFDAGAEVLDVDRGGDVTFHGEGQIAAYPVFDLKKRGKDLRRYIRGLEDAMALAAGYFGLPVDSAGGKKYTGLWSRGKKIGFIGIAVSGWITYHGLSLNVNDSVLKYFAMIRPCGLDGVEVASLSGLLGKDVPMDFVKHVLLDKLRGVFGFDYIHRSSQDAVMASENTA